MNWFQKNFRALIYISFLVPILTVAIVSISHVTKWYGISNPMSWAIYLSVGIEIAALSALAAISAKMGKKVYFPFLIVTIIQFIGNIFFAYQYIDINGASFKEWVDMVDPVVSFIGVESGNMISHKRFLALFAGGMLPLISLSFLHMLVKFEEEDKNKVSKVEPVINIDELSIEAGKKEALIEKENKDSVNITEEKLEKIREVLENIQEEKFGNVEPLKEPQEDVEMVTSNEEVIPNDDKISNLDSTLVEEADNKEKEPEVNQNTIVTTKKVYSDDDSKIKRLIRIRRNG